MKTPLSLLGLALFACLALLLAVTGCRVWSEQRAGWEFFPPGRTNTTPTPTPH